MMLLPYVCAECIWGISESLVPLVLSLPVAICAATLQCYFTGQVEAMQADARAFRLALLNDLTHLHAGRGLNLDQPSLGGGTH
jgi:hypothetical protein